MPPTSFTYDLNQLPPQHPLHAVKGITSTNKANFSNNTLVQDLKRGYILEDHPFRDATDETHIAQTLTQFQTDLDGGQKELMANSQAFLLPTAILTSQLTFKQAPITAQKVVNRMVFSTENEQLKIKGVSSLYCAQTANGLLQVKIAGEALPQTIPSQANERLIEAIDRAILLNKVDPSSNMRISYTREDGTPLELELEPLITIECNATVDQTPDNGINTPDWQIKLTSRAPQLKINDGSFEPYLAKVQNLDELANKAQQIEINIQKWTNRLGSFLGKLIGGQSELNKTFKEIGTQLETNDFVNQIQDKNLIKKLDSFQKFDTVTERSKALSNPTKVQPPPSIAPSAYNPPIATVASVERLSPSQEPNAASKVKPR